MSVVAPTFSQLSNKSKMNPIGSNIVLLGILPAHETDPNQFFDDGLKKAMINMITITMSRRTVVTNKVSEMHARRSACAMAVFIFPPKKMTGRARECVSVEGAKECVP